MISRIIDKAKNYNLTFSSKKKGKDTSSDQRDKHSSYPPTPRASSENARSPASSEHTNQIQSNRQGKHLKSPAQEFLTIVGPPVSPPCSPTEQRPSNPSTVGSPKQEEPHTHVPVLEHRSSSTFSSSSSPPTKPPNTQRQSAQFKLHDFRLVRTVGTGSFGRVHLCQSKHNDRYYAMKVMKKADVVRMKQVSHTINERELLLSISCPFIINLWGTFQDDANLYMVMDYVPGGELFSILRKSKRFTDDVARFYAAEVLLAIIYLHERDIIYRDLKPENILMDATGHIKVADFGFAKHVTNVTWTLCGTPDYLAPEVIQSKGYGKAVDFWSIGVLIFEMLAGYTPFYDDNQLRLYEKILASKPKYPSHFDPSARHLLEHLLTPDLSSRYGNLKRGYRDVIEHPWFASIDFDQLAERKVKAPYIPVLKGEGDASNFDKYPEETVPYGLSQPDPHRKYFAGF